MPPTHLPEGVVNRYEYDQLGNFVMPDPTSVHTYFNDFNTFTAGDWTITQVGSPTNVITSGDGGVLLVTNGGTDDDHGYYQLVGPGFTFESGKQFWFRARFKLSDVTLSDFLMGLYLLDTTPIASAPADGVYFSKLSGSAVLNGLIAKTAGGTTTTAVATLVNDTYVEVGMYYDGSETFKYWLNNAPAGVAAITNLPTVPLSVSFVLQNGEGAAKNMSIDYILAAKERG